MIPTDLSPLWNHLWQSTLCAVAVWLLTLAVRKNRAAVRYWLWFAASLKFLVPFPLLISAAGQLEWRATPVNAPPSIAFAVERVSQPFALPLSTPAPAQSNLIPAILLVLWLTGVGIGIGFWLRWWRSIGAARHAARPLSLNLPIPVMSAPGRLEPGVFGILKPVLLLPEGIAGRLSPEQLEAVIAHELCHVRRRDNLTAAIHMVQDANHDGHGNGRGSRYSQKQLSLPIQVAGDLRGHDFLNAPFEIGAGHSGGTASGDSR